MLFAEPQCSAIAPPVGQDLHSNGEVHVLPHFKQSNRTVSALRFQRFCQKEF